MRKIKGLIVFKTSIWKVELPRWVIKMFCLFGSGDFFEGNFSEPNLRAATTKESEK